MNTLKPSILVNLSHEISFFGATGSLNHHASRRLDEGISSNRNAPFGSVRNKFTLDFPAESKDAAEHMAYSTLGSRHKAKRRAIKIDSVEEIDPEHQQSQEFFTPLEKK